MIEYFVGIDSDLDQVMVLLGQAGGDQNAQMNMADFILAKDEGRIIGTVRIKKFPDQTLELASLAVSPDYRRQGIGKVLVKKILEKVKIRPVYLICSVEKEAFYKLNNFKKIDVADMPLDLKNDYDRVLTRVNISPEQILTMVITD